MLNILIRPRTPQAPPYAEAPRPRWKRALTLAGFLGASLVAGALGAALTASSVKTWYPTLAKPPGTPPPWVFGPVWTTLYTLMGVSAWMVYERRDRPGAKRTLALYGAQLGLNAAWSGLFFGAQSPALGLAGIIPLNGLIGAYTVSAWQVSKGASLLFLRYWGWVSYASYLNGGIWWLNQASGAQFEPGAHLLAGTLGQTTAV